MNRRRLSFALWLLGLLIVGTITLSYKIETYNEFNCSGDLARRIVTPEGDIIFEGVATMLLHPQHQSSVRYTGYIVDAMKERYRVNRLITFNLEQEDVDDLFVIKNSALSKGEHDDVPEELLYQNSILSGRDILIDIRKIDENTLIIGDTFVSTLFCTKRS